MNTIPDLRPYLAGVAALVSIGAAISTLEWLRNRRHLQDDGLFSWRVIGTRPAVLRPGPARALAGALLSYPRFVGVLGVRLVAVAVLPAALWTGHAATPVLAVALATTLLLNFRSPYGMDGSDQMATQVLGALFLGSAAGTPAAMAAALVFIALQACLSYFTSGVAKVLSPAWRQGDAVFRIFNTRTYGYLPAARFLAAHPAATRVAGWGAVAMECAFPLVLVVGWPYALVFLLWGATFHLMNALVMGLNSFLWSFVATYPAIVYTAFLLRAALA